MLWQAKCGLGKNFQTQSVQMEVSLLKTRSRDNESAVNAVGQGKLTARTEGQLM